MSGLYRGDLCCPGAYSDIAVYATGDNYTYAIDFAEESEFQINYSNDETHIGEFVDICFTVMKLKRRGVKVPKSLIKKMAEELEFRKSMIEEFIEFSREVS